MAHLPLPLYGFAAFFMVFWFGTWMVHVIAICYGRYKLHKKSCKLPTEAQPLPGVSILKPLMGVDPNLQHNLETFFAMDYPLYELLFCVEDKEDPAIQLVERLLASTRWWTPPSLSAAPMWASTPRSTTSIPATWPPSTTLS